MAGTSPQRAPRYSVAWPVRVRRVNETMWNAGHSVNLSVTGILLQVSHRYGVGEHVELEIDFLGLPKMKTTIRSVGRVVREDSAVSGAAIQFDVHGLPGR